MNRELSQLSRGREIWGFPKIAGDSNVTRDGKRTTSYLRAGHASADVVLALTGEEHTEPATTLRLYCRKTIPSADDSMEAALVLNALRHSPNRHQVGSVYTPISSTRSSSSQPWRV